MADAGEKKPEGREQGAPSGENCLAEAHALADAAGTSLPSMPHGAESSGTSASEGPGALAPLNPDPPEVGGAPVKETLWGGDYLKVWLSNFFLYFAFMLVTPLLPMFLRDTFGADKETSGVILAGYSVAALLIRPFGGYLVDTFPRKVVLLVAYFATCAIFLGCMVAGTLTIFAFFRTVHGAPFGAATVACTTVAIDSLPSSRRAEGIAYYGLSNNVASALGPTAALLVFHWLHSYEALFFLSFMVSFAGFVLNATLKVRRRPPIEGKSKLSLDRFFLLRGWPEALAMTAIASAYGIITTYVGIYGQDELGITGGTGLFFFLLACGLMLSRLVGTGSLRRGHVVRNALCGMTTALLGYLFFAAVHSKVGYYGAALVIGLGQGWLWPAFLTMFLGLAENSQRGTANASILVSWDLGLGIGMFVGGAFAERLGFHSAFWAAVASFVAGGAFFALYGRHHYMARRLRGA